MGSLFWIIHADLCKHKSLSKKEAGGSELEREDVNTEAEVREEIGCYPLGTEDGEGGREASNVAKL